MDQCHDDFFESVQRTSDKGKFMKLASFQQNHKYNSDGVAPTKPTSTCKAGH
jgi:hypothetical protein